MVISFPWTTFWFVFICMGLCDGRLQGLHVIKAPSSEELLAQKTNGTSVISVVAGGHSVDRLGESVGDHNSESSENGRSIVTSLSQQASNLGKGFIDFLRGNPSLATPSRRPLMPYPGPPMMRPHPLPLGFHRGRPVPHLTLLSSSPSESINKDRVGPSSGYPGDKLEGGFLPSKKQFHLVGHLDAPHTSSSSSNSVAINTSAIVLPAPKAPCDFYTDSLCIETNPYPSEQMRHRLRTMDLSLPNVRRMLADVQQQNANILIDGLTVQEEILYNYEHYYGSEDNNTHSYRDYAWDGGFVCPSDIKYVRLQKARSAHGQWKFIVNFDEFSQTVRLEKCLKPYSRCSYVFSYLNSECIQIYNFHRLLAWDVEHGFHIDVFKIPTACNCHIRSDSKVNTVVMVSDGSTASTASTSAKTSIKRKKFVDHTEMATERSYASETHSLVVKASQPEVGVDTPVSTVHYLGDASIRKQPQTKPPRFMLGVEPSAAQQLHLDLNVHDRHRTPDLRLVSSQNPNKWSLNVRRDQSSSTERVAKLDGPPPLISADSISGSNLHSSSSVSHSSNPFQRVRPVQSGGSAVDPSPRRPDVRRVNLNRNPVSDYMHTFRA